jgi:hypothetical protein
MLCIKLVNYCDKYTEMHGQQNVNKIPFRCFKLSRNLNKAKKKLAVEMTLTRAGNICCKGKKEISLRLLLRALYSAPTGTGT